MSSRININRVPQSYTPAYDAPRARQYTDSSSSFQDDPVAKLRSWATRVEDYVDIYSQPLRPHLPAIGRFLIVVTFLEDALRILTQWSDQLWYLQKYVVRQGSTCDVFKLNSPPFPTDTVASPGASATSSC